MKDVRLTRYQGVWIARVQMDDNHSYCFDLSQRISEQRAEAFNTLSRNGRITAARDLISYPHQLS